jgi:hypothetical protein
MLVGHFAVAFVGKRLEPQASLGTLALGAMLPDVLWPIFTLAGLEYTARPSGAASQQGFDAPFSHSLLTVLIWAALFSAACSLWRRYRQRESSKRYALILFAAVVSHWLLDAVSYKHALAPGVSRYVGLMLWNSTPATLAVEGGFWLVAIIVYLRATRARNWAGVYAFWPVVAFLTFVWIANIRKGPPPPEAVAGSLIFFFLLVAWAYWMNRARPASSLIE